MSVNSQEVTQTPGNNTVFQTWVLTADKKACKEGFAELCALVVNLNKTAKIRFGANENVNCVLGVGHDAWKKLEILKQSKAINTRLLAQRAISTSISAL